MTLSGPTTFRITPGYEPLVREAGLDAGAVFGDPRVVAWRNLPDRQNCTLDLGGVGGAGKRRLHVKRYVPAPGGTTPADAEVRGYELLVAAGVPTAPLVASGALGDGRSFTIWQDLAGYTPGDKLVASGVPFDRLLEPTADLAAALHAAGLHHRDLYLCHFLVREAPGSAIDVKLIDTARVARLANFLTRRRWVVKDLAQFWYSTTKLPVADAQRDAWLGRYARQRGLNGHGSLRASIVRKARSIARHDRKLNASQPRRNISIPV